MSTKDKRSSRKRNREEPEEYSTEIKKLRALPREARIITSKFNEGKTSQILDFFAFGANDKGQLGVNPDELGSSSELHHLEGINDLNSLSYCCGRDSSLVLEVNTIPNHRNVYTWGGDESVIVRESDEEMHAPTPIEILHESPLIQICSGTAHAIGLVSNGDVVTWGTYMDGKGKPIGFRPRMPVEEFGIPEVMEELENFKVVQVASTHNRCLALTETGDVFEWGNTKLNEKTLKRHTMDTLVPSQVLLSVKIVAIWAEANGGSIFAEDVDGKIWAWGNNQYYQCGIDEEVTVNSEVKNVEAAQERAKLKKKNISTHSRPAKAKQINSILEDEKTEVKKISSGRLHTVMLTTNGDVFTWGNNAKGQLGNGENFQTEDVLSVPTRLPLGDLAGKIVDIASGPFHTLLLTKDGDVYGFGANKDKCLGKSSQEIIANPIKIKLSHKGLRGKIVGISCGARHNLVAALTE
jgi:regulator of chromosome condensation